MKPTQGFAYLETVCLVKHSDCTAKEVFITFKILISLGCDPSLLGEYWDREDSKVNLGSDSSLLLKHLLMVDRISSYFQKECLFY